MSQFSFMLIGSTRPIVIDVNAGNLQTLSQELAHARFLQGDLVTENGELVRTLVPVGRIQMISEAVE